MSLFGKSVQTQRTQCPACSKSITIAITTGSMGEGDCSCQLMKWLCDASGKVTWTAQPVKASPGSLASAWPSYYPQPSPYSQQQLQALQQAANYLNAPYPYNPTPKITTEMPSHLKDMPEMQESLIGYRAYKLLYSKDKHGIELSGARAAWPSREFTAKCDAPNLEGKPTDSYELCRIHLADPQSQCVFDNHGCGVYAMRKSQSIDYVRLDSYRVIGECSLYGWVASHTKGFRAEKARIERLTYLHYGAVLADDKVIAQKLHERYGVPVDLQSFEGWQNSG